MQLGANARPKASEIALRVRRAGTVPFAVTVSRFSRSVIFRRRSQGVKLPDVSELIADIFKPTDAGHQLAATYRRVGDRAIIFFNQADAVTVFVFEIQPLEKFTCAALLLAPVSHAVFTRVCVSFADTADCNVQMFAPCSRNAT